MRANIGLVLATAAGLIWLSAGIAAPKAKDAEPDTKALTQEVVEKFIRALTAEDVEAVMGLTDVPFCWDLAKTYSDQKDVRIAFSELFRDKDLTRASIAIDEIDTYAKLSPKLSKKQREYLDQIVDKDDRLAFIKDTTRPGNDKSCVVVRVRGGKAKVVGFFG